jgi:hypothetical protein
MGILNPGSKYIYENDGNKIYARAEGSSERILIGETNLSNTIRENELWYKIRKAAETNPTLQKELDRVKVLYYLSVAHGT